MVLPRCALPWLLLGAIGASCLVTRSAHAGEDDEREKVAELLFDEGRRLMQAGHFAEACPKLKESQDLDPGLGTLVNLGLCYEKSGRTASAWGVFRDAASQAASKGDDERERYARERADALEPVLSRLVLVVDAEASQTNLRVRRDGTEIPRAFWGKDVPVDPGEHVIDATADGRRAWQGRSVATARQTVTVRVPELEAEGPPRVAAIPVRPAEDRPSSWHRPAAVVVGGLGLGALAFGTITALRATSKYDEANEHCHGEACSEAGLSLRDRAIELADVATVSFVAGGVLLVGGVVLWVIAPRRPASTSSVRLALPRLQGEF